MKARYFLDIYSLQMTIRQAIRPYMGVAADLMDITHIVGGCFEYALAGILLQQEKSPYEHMTALSVPTQVGSHAIDKVIAEFQRIIPLTIGHFDNELIYHYEVVGYTDLLVGVFTKPKVPQRDDMDAFRALVAEHVNNGDWVNERLRHLAGLP